MSARLEFVIDLANRANVTAYVIDAGGRLPIGALPAGTYELRIRVTDGTREESRTAYFTLRD